MFPITVITPDLPEPLLASQHVVLREGVVRRQLAALGEAADIDTVVDNIAAIAGFAEANAGSLHELDVNPLIVTVGGAIAADAVIRISGV